MYISVSDSYVHWIKIVSFCVLLVVSNGFIEHPMRAKRGSKATSSGCFY